MCVDPSLDGRANAEKPNEDGRIAAMSAIRFAHSIQGCNPPDLDLKDQERG